MLYKSDSQIFTICHSASRSAMLVCIVQPLPSGVVPPDGALLLSSVLYMSVLVAACCMVGPPCQVQRCTLFIDVGDAGRLAAGTNRMTACCRLWLHQLYLMLTCADCFYVFTTDCDCCSARQQGPSISSLLEPVAWAAMLMAAGCLGPRNPMACCTCINCLPNALPCQPHDVIHRHCCTVVFSGGQ